MDKKRTQWGSNFGFIMSAIGSAVGLGNIWAFPFKMGQNGGFAFLIVYVILAVFVGLMIMVSELAIGRRTKLGVLGAYQKISKRFGWIGWLAVLSPLILLSFYCVLGGYCVEYMCYNLSEVAFGVGAGAADAGETIFSNMLSNQLGALIFALIFLGMCVIIVKNGIKGGIEKFNKIGMPALFVMLIIIIIRAVTLPGASEGIKFMLEPNLEPLKNDFIGVISTAGCQMFLSLSLAMGAMVTYGSYLGNKENIVKSAGTIIFADTLVAVLAGFAVLPAAFALNGSEAVLSGPKLLFITLQDVFNQMGFVGPIFGVIFYLLVIIAAVSSAISLLEVIATMIIDKREAKNKPVDRVKITAYICIPVVFLMAIVAVDGLGANGMWTPFSKSVGIIGSFNDCWLDFFDTLAEGILMPIGGLLMAIMIGWEYGTENIRDEIMLEGNKFKSYKLYRVCIRFVVPVMMLLILFGQISEIFGLKLL